MKRFVLLFALGCGGSAPSTPPSAPNHRAEPRAARGAIDCASLPPCRPELGVCLRCDEPDNPRWVWNEAPGSPYLFALSPATVAAPHPDLRQSCCWAHPFHHDIPDCARFDLDERGMPLRMRTVGEVEDLYRWTYEDGRVVSVAVDEVPFCVANDYGDEAPCGAPDGAVDRTSPIEWTGRRAVAGRSQWLFDDAGRLARWRDPDGRSGHNVFADGQLLEERRDLGTERLITRFHYDPAGRLVLAERSSAQRSEELRWEWDAHGWPTRRRFPSGIVEYDNEYDDDGRLVRRIVRPLPGPGQSGPPSEWLRHHDAHGLLVEESLRPNAQMGGRVTTWERDARGVPVAVTVGGNRIDQRCLRPLADRL